MSKTYITYFQELKTLIWDFFKIFILFTSIVFEDAGNEFLINKT